MWETAGGQRGLGLLSSGQGLGGAWALFSVQRTLQAGLGVWLGMREQKATYRSSPRPAPSP